MLHLPMQRAGLAEFIDEHRAAIVAEWQKFAQTLTPAASELGGASLRDHADEILNAIVLDMRSAQTEDEEAGKSKGRGKAKRMERVGRLHAALRLESGFQLDQIVSEYRALRASVLRLWAGENPDPHGVNRFNEAVDEAIIEAVDQFMKTTGHYREESLGILGHDLRNPLNGIVMGSTLLVNSKELSDASIKVASRVLNSAHRMNRMIDDLLDLTRTRLGSQIPVVRKPIDLGPLCRQVLGEFEGLRPAGDLKFVAVGDLHGEWDADRISQVVSNLVRNAVEHGARSAPITLAAEGDGDEVCLSVHNVGSPIPESALPRNLQPLIRHAADGRANRGLGLGLYIADQNRRRPRRPDSSHLEPGGRHDVHGAIAAPRARASRRKDGARRSGEPRGQRPLRV